jgi:pimeloyl-ACP methyl ester carboxylesterase
MRRLGELLIGLTAAVWAHCATAAPSDELYAKPGKLVAAGDGAQLNLYCQGAGSPTVVFEAGFTDWSPAFATVQPEVAKFTRNCAYDRAGSGFSTAGPLPRTVERIARELHAALHAAGIEGPYILVGHAFGGDPARAFVDLYLDETAGLVMEEADASDVEPADMRRADDEGGQAYIPTLKACRDAIAAGRPLPSAPSRPGQPKRTCAQAFFRGLPERMWSSQLNAKLMEITTHKVALWDAVISEMAETPGDEVWLIEHKRSLGSRPVRIVTSGNHAVGDLTRRRPLSLDHLKFEYEVALAQSRWLDLSSDAKQVFTTNSSEYIQFDEPQVLVGAIREVWDKTKK